MNKDISINFVGGSHGHFLGFLLNVAFNHNGAPLASVTRDTGTWHLTTDMPGLQAYHWWGEHIYSDGTWPQLSEHVVTISLNSLIEVSLSSAYWRREWDGFNFMPQEIIGLSKDEFLAEWHRRQLISDAPDKSDEAVANRRKVLDNVISVLYRQGNDTLATEMQIIRMWNICGGSNNNARSNMNIQWLTSLPTNIKVFEFSMLSLYDKYKSIALIQELNTAFALDGIKASDEEMCSIIDYFVASIPEQPNLSNIQAAFDATVNRNKFDLTGLTTFDKIVLWNMVTRFNLHNNDIRRTTDYISEFPKCAAELSEIMSRKIHQ